MLSTPPSLWTFACELYAKPGVAPACLQLQDDYDVDVPLLLFCCWSGRYYGELSPQFLQPALAFSREWAHNTTRPLRTIRRQMKGQYQSQWPVEALDWEGLREQVKSLELASEKMLLEGLSKLLGALSVVDGSVDAVLSHIQYCFQLEVNDQVSESLACLLNAMFDGGGGEIRALMACR